MCIVICRCGADAQGISARTARTQRRPHCDRRLDRWLLRRSASRRLRELTAQISLLIAHCSLLTLYVCSVRCVVRVEGRRAQSALQPVGGARDGRRGLSRIHRSCSAPPREPHRLDGRVSVLPAWHPHAAGRRRAQRVRFLSSLFSSFLLSLSLLSSPNKYSIRSYIFLTLYSEHSLLRSSPDRILSLYDIFLFCTNSFLYRTVLQYIVD